MAKEITFGSKKSIDDWFEAAIDGLARGISTQVRANRTIKREEASIYSLAITHLNKIREMLYQSIDEKEKPETIKYESVVRRYF
ncbi:MAG: hypothetical protein AABX96_02925 [Nanoarchaeota archaeon]